MAELAWAWPWSNLLLRAMVAAWCVATTPRAGLVLRCGCRFKGRSTLCLQMIRKSVIFCEFQPFIPPIGDARLAIAV